MGTLIRRPTRKRKRQRHHPLSAQQRRACRHRYAAGQRRLRLARRRRPPATANGRNGAAYRYIALGWGERDFYLNTPRWRDLTAATAARALSGANETLIHADYLAAPPAEGEYAVRFTVSREQYRRLAENLARHFKRRGGKTLPLADAHYTADDAFYEAEGRYHLFNTCNSWLNRRLTESGLRGVVWTPFAAPLLDAYRKP
ncbi:DUF2459 domain-containing protein [Neisseria bacilliformis]|uniref:DUF2459 domain-containing protein n=1 Tax=Neisseria bacilliformis TaxID=267212 RepID=UPI001FD4DBC9|nr:DUF2459 domain-containing protein [Neisseria bacilliformis]